MKNAIHDEQSATLIQLHIAEYNGLVNRGSYFMTLQFGLIVSVPAIALLAYYLYQLPSSARVRSLTGWATIAVLQILGIVWANMMLEQFALVRYIECVLRPEVEQVTGETQFWLYEPYLIKNRPLNPVWGNYSVAGSVVVALIIFALIRFSEFSRWDALGLVMNLGCLIALSLMSSKIGKIQSDWAKCDQHVLAVIESEAPRIKSRGHHHDRTRR
jgi:hypothetical protein